LPNAGRKQKNRKSHQHDLKLIMVERENMSNILNIMSSDEDSDDGIYIEPLLKEIHPC